MIEFEIDGHLFTAEVHEHEVPNSVAFTTPDGVTYWLESPSAV